MDVLEKINIRASRQSIRNLTNAIYKTNKLTSFSCYDLDEKLIIALSRACVNLTQLDLSLSNITNVDGALSQVFKNNRKLMFLTLRSFRDLTGESFLCLEKNNVKKISLHNAFITSFKINRLFESLPTFERLHTLEFFDISFNSCDYLVECIILCHKLKHLVIKTMYFSEKNLINLVSNLKDLQGISFSFYKSLTVTKRFFDYVSLNFLNLKFLDIGVNSSISDNHLKVITNFSQLEVLKINRLGINGSGLGIFPNLKELECNHCRNLTDNHLIRFLRCTPKLELLQLVDCCKITNAVLKAAIKET